MSGTIRTLPVMSETLIGYARCSTDAQDLTPQRKRLRELGVAEDREPARVAAQHRCERRGQRGICVRRAGR